MGFGPNILSGKILKYRSSLFSMEIAREPLSAKKRSSRADFFSSTRSI